MRRVAYLDGLRGLAAAQVVLDHYAHAFAPALWARLGILADGQCAVLLFFLISGFVLTPSFERSPGVRLNLLRRVVRLGLPALAAVLIAAALSYAAPGLGRRAADASGSGWLQGFTAARPVSAFLADVSGLSLVAGYGATGLLPLPGLPRLATSTNPPLWSLHIELWGSAWVLLLVRMRERSIGLHTAALLCSVYVIGTNELVLFTVGHLCFHLTRRAPYPGLAGHRLAPVAGALLIVLGIALCDARLLPGDGLPAPPLPRGLLQTFSWLAWQKELGAAAIFIGVLLTPAAQRCLDMRLPRLLGRLSFPVYLLHWPVMVLVGGGVFLAALPAGAAVAAAAALAIGMTVTFVSAGLFERLCDQPATAAARRLAAGGP